MLTTRGGDFELHIGQDVSIGYLSHDDTAVHLPTTIGSVFSDVMTSSMASSEKISPSKDFLMTRSASAIDTESAMRYLK